MQMHHWLVLAVAVVIGYYLHKFYPGILPAS